MDSIDGIGLTIQSVLFILSTHSCLLV